MLKVLIDWCKFESTLMSNSDSFKSIFSLEIFRFERTLLVIHYAVSLFVVASVLDIG